MSRRISFDPKILPMIFETEPPMVAVDDGLDCRGDGMRGERERVFGLLVHDEGSCPSYVFESRHSLHSLGKVEDVFDAGTWCEDGRNGWRLLGGVKGILVMIFGAVLIVWRLSKPQKGVE